MVINRDAEPLAAEFRNPLVSGERAKSFLFVPLTAGDEVIGIVELQHIDREDAFSESDVRLLETLANSMSVALENARLFDETQRLLKVSEQRAAELASINTVSQALVAESDPDRMIQLIGEQLLDIFKPDIAYVALLDLESNMIEFPYKHGDEFPAMPYGQGLTSRIIESDGTRCPRSP